MIFKKLPKLTEKDISMEEFGDKHYNRLVDEVDTIFDNNVTLSENMSMDIKSVSIGIGATVVVTHGLKVTPKYRMILRQTGNGVITDAGTWDSTKIFLKNNGAETVKLTIGIFKE